MQHLQRGIPSNVRRQGWAAHRLRGLRGAFNAHDPNSTDAIGPEDYGVKDDIRFINGNPDMGFKVWRNRVSRADAAAPSSRGPGDAISMVLR